MYFLMIEDRIFDNRHFYRLHWTSHNRIAIKGGMETRQSWRDSQ